MCADGVTSNAKVCEYGSAPATRGMTDTTGWPDINSPGFGDECPPKADGLLEDALVNYKAVGEPLIQQAALTDRETQILQSILAGRTNKQIARALCRSQRTVEYHRNRLMQKLHAHSAAELVRLAIMAGIT